MPGGSRAVALSCRPPLIRSPVSTRTLLPAAHLVPQWDMLAETASQLPKNMRRLLAKVDKAERKDAARKDAFHAKQRTRLAGLAR